MSTAVDKRLAIALGTVFPYTLAQLERAQPKSLRFAGDNANQPLSDTA
jgi:hypothetical protein